MERAEKPPRRHTTLLNQNKMLIGLRYLEAIRHGIDHPAICVLDLEGTPYVASYESSRSDHWRRMGSETLRTVVWFCPIDEAVKDFLPGTLNHHDGHFPVFIIASGITSVRWLANVKRDNSK